MIEQVEEFGPELFGLQPATKFGLVMPAPVPGPALPAAKSVVRVLEVASMNASGNPVWTVVMPFTPHPEASLSTKPLTLPSQCFPLPIGSSSTQLIRRRFGTSKLERDFSPLILLLSCTPCAPHRPKRLASSQGLSTSAVPTKCEYVGQHQHAGIAESLLYPCLHGVVS